MPRCIGRRWAAVAVAAAALLWCGDALAAETRAILLRGYLGLFSGGLDRLADELRTRGINAEVRRHLYWTAVVSDILRDRTAGKIGTSAPVAHAANGGWFESQG
jgi:hypothetical protein